MERFGIVVKDDGQEPTYHINVKHYTVKGDVSTFPLITPMCIDMAELDYHITELINNLEQLRIETNIKMLKDIGDKTYSVRSEYEEVEDNGKEK